MQVTFKNYAELPITLTVEQIGEILGIGRVQAYNIVHVDSFPKIKIGRRIVIPKQAFIKWMEIQAME